MTGEREPIGVIGVGWVGLVTAACFAELGHRVIARDILPEKVEALSRGETTIHEPGLGELLKRNAERLTFTTEMGELLDAARLLFVCVDTPPTASGDADLSRVRSVVEELGDGDHVLVMKSTVPAGTGHSIRRDLPGVPYVSCPEFLKEGSAVEDFLHPDRVVIGADPGDEAAGDAVARLYEPLGGEIVRTDVASAEMIKLASNAFLATKISFVNEIANVCEEVGADVAEVARGMGLDQRIGPAFLRAGNRLRGFVFPEGPQGAQAARRQHRLPLPAAHRRDRGERAAEAAGREEAPASPRVACRAGAWRCSAWPSSPTPTTCARRRAWCWRRGCRARAPRSPPMTRLPPTPRGACSTASSSATRRWRRSTEPTPRSWSPSGPSSPSSTGRRPPERMARPLLIDGRNFLDPNLLRSAGFEYEGIGRAVEGAVPAGTAD